MFGLAIKGFSPSCCELPNTIELFVVVAFDEMLKFLNDKAINRLQIGVPVINDIYKNLFELIKRLFTGYLVEKTHFSDLISTMF